MSERGDAMPVVAAAGSEVPMEAALDVIEDRVHARRAIRARSLDLSQQLRINAVVDMSDWLRDRVEVHYRRGRGGTIRPILVDKLASSEV